MEISTEELHPYIPESDKIILEAEQIIKEIDEDNNKK